jgi:hypothetical protein
VMWQDGTMSEWSYAISGVAGNRRLHLTGAGKNKVDEWVEVP